MIKNLTVFLGSKHIVTDFTFLFFWGVLTPNRNLRFQTILKGETCWAKKDSFGLYNGRLQSPNALSAPPMRQTSYNENTLNSVFGEILESKDT